jgi:hypothetical protein
MRKFIQILFVAALTIPLTTLAGAQAKHGAEGVARVAFNSSIYAGYSFLTQNLRGGTGLNGWEVAYSASEGHGLRFKADVFSYTGTDVGAQQKPMYFMVGQEVGHGFLGTRIFAHGLVGMAHTYGDWFYGGSGNGTYHANTNSFVADFGGGLDKTLAGPMAWRFQGDYLYSNFTVNDNQIHTLPNHFVRLSTGLVIRF